MTPSRTRRTNRGRGPRRSGAPLPSAAGRRLLRRRLLNAPRSLPSRKRRRSSSRNRRRRLSKGRRSRALAESDGAFVGPRRCDAVDATSFRGRVDAASVASIARGAPRPSPHAGRPVARAARRRQRNKRLLRSKNRRRRRRRRAGAAPSNKSPRTAAKPSRPRTRTLCVKGISSSRSSAGKLRS